MKTAHFAILLLFAFAGCARPATPTQPPPAADKLALAATARSLGTLSPSATFAPTTTPTRKPTWTPHPTSIGYTVLRPTPDATRWAELSPDIPINCGQIWSEEWVVRSPGGSWLAVTCSRGELLVTHRDGMQWSLRFEDDFKGGLAPYAILGGVVVPLHWTANDAYLYFAPLFLSEWGMYCHSSLHYEALYRLDLNTGEVAAVLPPIPNTTSTYDVVFSPQGDKLAFDAGRPIVFDLQTGDYFPLRGVDVQAGDLVWSPDGTELAFSTCPSNEDNPDAPYTMQVYSLETGVSHTVYTAEMGMVLIRPLGGAQVRINDCNRDMWDRECRNLYYEWATGRLSTPTP